MNPATKESIIAAPSIGAIVLAWADVPLATWQVRIGLLFLVVQLLYLARKWYREEFPKKRKARQLPPDTTDRAAL